MFASFSLLIVSSALPIFTLLLGNYFLSSELFLEFRILQNTIIFASLVALFGSDQAIMFSETSLKLAYLKLFRNVGRLALIFIIIIPFLSSNHIYLYLLSGVTLSFYAYVSHFLRSEKKIKLFQWMNLIILRLVFLLSILVLYCTGSIIALVAMLSVSFIFFAEIFLTVNFRQGKLKSSRIRMPWNKNNLRIVVAVLLMFVLQRYLYFVFHALDMDEFLINSVDISQLLGFLTYTIGSVLGREAEKSKGVKSFKNLISAYSKTLGRLRMYQAYSAVTVLIFSYILYSMEWLKVEIFLFVIVYIITVIICLKLSSLPNITNLSKVVSATKLIKQMLYVGISLSAVHFSQPYFVYHWGFMFIFFIVYMWHASSFVDLIKLEVNGEKH